MAAISEVSADRRRSRRRLGLGPVQVLDHTGLLAWQWDAAMAAGLVPPADVDGTHWSTEAAAAVAAERDTIVAAVGSDGPIGGHRAAARLAARTGLAAERADVEDLADAGVLQVAGYFKEWPLWDCRQLDAVDVADVARVVAEREAWLAASVSAAAAAARLGWSYREFMRVAGDRGLQPGRLSRYDTDAVDALAADEVLARQVRQDRLLPAAEAAVHLEIRPTDFAYLAAAGLAAPHQYTWVRAGRYRDVAVPLYRAGDLDALRGHPDIDWGAVRAVKAGQASPLRHLARRPVDRAAVIRRGVAELADRFKLDVWCWWNNTDGCWEIDFERSSTGPDVEEFRAAVAAHRSLAAHSTSIMVATKAGAAMRWARAMHEPGAAVILDTETTGLAGYLVEVSVIDAATGETLLDTLVQPGCPVEPEARWVHGISDEELGAAPTLAEVLPELLPVTAGRSVLAYNCEFDHDTLTRHAHRDGLDLCGLADPGRWECLMNRRSQWLMRRRWLRLNGGHRALGDCQAAYELLCAMTAPPRRTAFPARQ